MDTVAEMFGPEQAEAMVTEMTRRGASEGIDTGSTLPSRSTPSPRTGCGGSPCTSTVPRCRPRLIAGVTSTEVLGDAFRQASGR